MFFGEMMQKKLIAQSRLKLNAFQEFCNSSCKERRFQSSQIGMLLPKCDQQKTLRESVVEFITNLSQKLKSSSPSDGLQCTWKILGDIDLIYNKLDSYTSPQNNDSEFIRKSLLFIKFSVIQFILSQKPSSQNKGVRANRSVVPELCQLNPTNYGMGNGLHTFFVNQLELSESLTVDNLNLAFGILGFTKEDLSSGGVNIDKAYRKLALRFHPDKRADLNGYEFTKLTKAHRVVERYLAALAMQG